MVGDQNVTCATDGSGWTMDFPSCSEWHVCRLNTQCFLPEEFIRYYEKKKWILINLHLCCLDKNKNGK